MQLDAGILKATKMSNIGQWVCGQINTNSKPTKQSSDIRLTADPAEPASSEMDGASDDGSGGRMSCILDPSLHTSFPHVFTGRCMQVRKA